MSEDCQSCGTAMFELDEDRLCPGCSGECLKCEGTGYIENPDYRTDRDAMALACPDCDDEWYNWEEADYVSNRCFYENGLEGLEELSQRERHPTKGKM